MEGSIEKSETGRVGENLQVMDGGSKERDSHLMQRRQIRDVVDECQELSMLHKLCRGPVWNAADTVEGRRPGQQSTRIATFDGQTSRAP